MNQELHLNPDTIRHANSASHFDAGDVLGREAHEVYQNGLKTFVPAEDWTEEQRAYAAEREAGWCDLVSKAYNDMILRRASWVPWTVAGPANYNYRQQNKRADAALKASSEWGRKLDSYLQNTRKHLHAMVPAETQIEKYRNGKCDDPISSDDPAAAEKLAARIAFLKERHEQGKALNAYYRRHKTCKGFPGYTDEQAAHMNEIIVNSSPWAQQPYPSFTMTNENANIRRLEARLQQLTRARARAEATAEDAEKTFAGLRIVEDTDANRIRLYFDEKPDDDTRALLKSRGFRWSPNAKAWQRQLNGNGRYAARALVDALGLAQQEPPAPEATEPETITFDEFVCRAAKADLQQ